VGGEIEVAPLPACLGDVLAFFLGGAQDNGGIKNIGCSSEAIPPVGLTISWVVTTPTGPVSGSGAVAIVEICEQGTYACTFTATAERDCAPVERTFGPETVSVSQSATLALDPSAIPASSDWQTILPYAGAHIIVTWDPPECAGALQIVDVDGDDGFEPPTPGTVEHLRGNTWIYRAFEERPTELCPKAVNVKIGAMACGNELDHTSVRVLPIHTWLTTNHQHHPGEPSHPPDLDDFALDLEYLSWKYAGVLASTGGAFGNVTIEPNSCVQCPAFIGPCVYACTLVLDDSVRFGTSAFTGSENQAASIIGHELMHTVGFTGECAAYQWEVDHAAETGISLCDPAYLESVNQYLDAHCQ
jgi:hypothetical protein